MPSRDLQPDNHATAFFSEAPKLAHVVQTLAAHGGGAVSLDLAFDLVLNEVVEQARHATGATGAAIALFRDGELVCRATAGENAPDLGVRVDGTSGLAGACVSTGEMQQCRDTDTDSRVNAEACRRLGVRSMMIAPLVDAERIIGIIQVFSSGPNAFGKREISALQVLAGRIAESNREAEAGIPLAEPISEVSPQTVPAEIEAEPLQTGDPGQLSVAEAQPRRFDLWGTVLVVLVIAAAVLLGLVIGWRRAAEGTNRQPEAQATLSSATLQPTSLGNSEHGAPSPSAPGTSTATARTGSPVIAAPPNGGLLVTENGKVVYRSPDGRTASASHHQRSLIHRVEPEYPADARARHIQGSVVLDVQVLGTGAVGKVAVVSGDPVLAQAATDAVKQWRYQADTVNGQGVESQTRITVKFTLPST